MIKLKHDTPLWCFNHLVERERQRDYYRDGEFVLLFNDLHRVRKLKLLLKIAITSTIILNIKLCSILII